MEIRPQRGPQEDFLSTSADIAIYGGAAGGGKTYGLQLDPIRHIHVPRFNAVFFRRTTPQITNPGGMWDASMQLFPHVKGKPTPHVQKWTWPNNVEIKMSHLEHDVTVLQWQGTEICGIYFDELTHFSEYQFWYMLSRNRSTCGVRPYLRASTNPDPDSWVASFISWWIGADGHPIPERSGVIRWFVRINDIITWGDSKEELLERFPGRDPLTGELTTRPRSVTFIGSKLTDNRALMEKDPDYMATLMSLPRVERERLLGGNWLVRKEEGTMFPSSMARKLPSVPNDVIAWVRRWDLAATRPSEDNPDPDATAGVLMGKRKNGRFVVADLQWVREDAHEVRELIKKTAKKDRLAYKGVYTLFAIDPGQAGKDQFSSLSASMAGLRVKGARETGDKETRAEPFSDQWNAGNVDIVEGPWNTRYLSEMGRFPNKKAHDDIPDASSGGFNALVGKVRKIQKFKSQAS